jgi:hypothetical protein
MDSTVETTTDVVLANPEDTKQLAQIRQAANELLAQARDLMIETPDDYSEGGALITQSKNYEVILNGLMRPWVDDFHQAHKRALARLKGFLNPLAEVRTIMNPKMSMWRAEEKRLEDERMAKLREAARKEEEERQVEHALEREKAGRHEEAEAILNRPVETPIVHVESTVPKIEGQSIRKLWRARVVDAKLVPDKYKIIDMSGLNALARSLKERAECPGVEFYCDETTAIRSA